jgi:hypothetical protein
MESLIQEIYDEIGSCQLSNNTRNEIRVNNANIEQLEKEYPTDWVRGAESGDVRRCATINAAKYAGDVKFAHQMCMGILLRDKERLNIQIKQIGEVPHVKNTDIMDLPECNYVAIHNKLNELNSEIVKNNQEIVKLKNAFDVAYTDKYDKKTNLGRPSNWWSTSDVFSCRTPGGRAYKSSLETLLRDKERLKIQLDHTNKIWEKYNYDTQRNAQNHEIEQLKVTMADTQCIIQNHEIEQLKISVADTQRIAQNHEIEQLKVTMALMIKSQEKLELKNKELEEQIKEATDRQNQRWWQRS